MRKEIKKIHTLIISDLHLGSAVGQPKKVHEMLKSKNFHKFIPGFGYVHPFFDISTLYKSVR